MDKQDKKEIKMVMGEVLEEVVLPEIQEVKNKLSEHDKKFETIENKLSKHDEKFESIEEDVEDLQLTTNRIETKLDAQVERHHNLSIKIDKIDKRVLKLETKS